MYETRNQLQKEWEKHKHMEAINVNNILLKNQWINEEIKEKSESTLRQMEIKTQLSKIYGMQQKQSQRDIHSDIGFPPKTEKISNKQPNLPLKGIRKRTIKAQRQQKKRNNKDKEEIKENNNKCSIKRSMKPRLF